MNVLSRHAAGPSIAPGGSVACIGAFDGVHLGHQALLAAVRARAEAAGLAALAISFEPIPREYFARGAPVPRLTGAREKLLQLRAAGMDRVLLLRFDARLAAMTAAGFETQVLAARAGVRELWVGEDFRYGHGRAGNIQTLREAGARLGFSVHVLDDVGQGGERISSSRIRAHLAAGEFDAAAALLGRRFTFCGRVRQGRKLGRELGWPTANIGLGRRTPPVDGILAVRVHGPGLRAHPGVASLGTRPTVGGVEPLLEVHLFDFAGDLYGQRLEVEPVARLRDERHFETLEAMVHQIGLDAAEARSRLAEAPVADISFPAAAHAAAIPR